MSDLALLEGAARAAGALLLDMRTRGVEVRRKADGSPVTAADLASDALLRRELGGARPGYGWLSEETADDGARLERERVFVVDPLDGTTAYIKGRPWFAVSLAVVENGRATAGVVYAPELDAMYAAERGGGARLNGATIRATDRHALAGASLVGDPGQFPAEDWPAVSVTRRNALALRMALVGEGAFDAAISVATKREWDLAAGAVIAEEAGAVAADRSGAPLRFNSPDARCPGLVCCARGLLPLILERTAARERPPRALRARV